MVKGRIKLPENFLVQRPYGEKPEQHPNSSPTWLCDSIIVFASNLGRFLFSRVSDAAFSEKPRQDPLASQV